MWLRGVPPVHTTPASSWKIGARNVAPASRTSAMTPVGAVVHQLEDVVGRVEHPQLALARVGS